MKKATPTKIPILFSTGTTLAYKINETYYGGFHYVWCSSLLDSIHQPPTSSPVQICNNYLKAIATHDRHHWVISNNKAGILRGADAKIRKGVITKKQYNEIRSLVASAEFDSFMPIVYIIDTMKSSYKPVPIKKKQVTYRMSILLIN